MKVLLYSANRDTPPEDILYYGLRENLGKNNVTLYKPRTYKAPNYSVTFPKEERSDDSGIRERADDFGIIIFLPGAFPDRDFKFVLNRESSAVKVFFDPFDDYFVRGIYTHPEIRHYFKRELYADAGILYRLGYLPVYSYTRARLAREYSARWLFSRYSIPIGIALQGRFRKLRPYPITFMPRKMRPRKKVYDVSFAGRTNSFERIKYTRCLRSLRDVNSYVADTSREPLRYRDYAGVLCGSKAALSLRGAGYDTIRYWEIPCYGAALLSQRTPIVIPHDFRDMESALYFSSAGEMRQKIEEYVVRSEEWKEIAREGQRLFFKYHTPKARARQLLDAVKA